MQKFPYGPKFNAMCQNFCQPRKLSPKEFLAELDEKYTITDQAKLIGVNRLTITNWRKILGFPSKVKQPINPKLLKIQESED